MGFQLHELLTFGSQACFSNQKNETDSQKPLTGASSWSAHARTRHLSAVANLNKVPIPDRIVSTFQA